MRHLQNISAARHGIGFFRAAIASSSDLPAGLYFFQKSFSLPTVPMGAAARAAAYAAGFYFYHVYAYFHAAYHRKTFFLSIFLFFSEKLLTFFLYVL